MNKQQRNTDYGFGGLYYVAYAYSFFLPLITIDHIILFHLQQPTSQLQASSSNYQCIHQRPTEAVIVRSEPRLYTIIIPHTLLCTKSLHGESRGFECGWRSEVFGVLPLYSSGAFSVGGGFFLHSSAPEAIRVGKSL